MKSKELKSKSAEELVKELSKVKETLRKFVFGGAGGKIRNVKTARNLKKDIARILTEIASRKSE